MYRYIITFIHIYTFMNMLLLSCVNAYIYLLVYALMCLYINIHSYIYIFVGYHGYISCFMPM